jgi:nicotinamide-nucleotide amidase
MPPEVADLATVPRGFDMLQNDVGTAVGLWHADTRKDEERLIAVLPGVPPEMKSIYENGVEPRLLARADLQDLAHRTLLTTGVPESSLQRKIGDLSDWLGEDLKLAYLPSTNGVRLRLTAYARDRAVAENRIDTLEEELRRRIGKYIFGTGKDTLEGVVGGLLRERSLTVATAESATGGLIGHRLTAERGSSDYFLGGIVAYANAVKTDVLGVEPSTLREYGAVSLPVAEQMAAGAAERLEASIGVSTSGIAGPGGGSDEKPVGTVCIGFAKRMDDGTTDVDSVRLQLTNDRSLNKELFATSALEMIRRKLLW